MAPRDKAEAQELLERLAAMNREFEGAALSDKTLDRIERLFKYGWLIGALIVSVTTWVIRLTVSISDLKEDIGYVKPKVAEMWFLKENGISNKEKFSHDRGYPAPDFKDK